MPVTDSSVLRGDGCFEAVRVYDSVPFALKAHLDRLARSAEMLGLGLPDEEVLAEWTKWVAAESPDSVVRIVVTRGGAVPGASHAGICAVFSHPVGDHPISLRLVPVHAPWHSAGRRWDLMGSKTLSYAPNEAARRRAEGAGFDDAILVSDHDVILELPTSALGWVVDGVLETPELELGILDSITRRFVLTEARAVGIDVVEGIWTTARLDVAEECFVMSTVREIIPVTTIGDTEFVPGPVTRIVADRYAALVAASSDRG